MDVREEGLKRQEFWELRQDRGLGGRGGQGHLKKRDEAEGALKVSKCFNTDQ